MGINSSSGGALSSYLPGRSPCTTVVSMLSFVIIALQLKRSISSSLGGALSSYLPGRSPCTTVVSVLSFCNCFLAAKAEYWFFLRWSSVKLPSWKEFLYNCSLCVVPCCFATKVEVNSSSGGALSSYFPGRSPCTTVVSVLSFVALQLKWSVSSFLGGALSSYLLGRNLCTAVVSVLSFVIVALQLKWSVSS